MADPVPVELPPGFFGNGTPYAAGGRYATGNLVRFLNGYVRPIGGWKRHRGPGGGSSYNGADWGSPNDATWGGVQTTFGAVEGGVDDVPPIFDPAAGEVARNVIQWQDNLGGAHIVIGTNEGLYEIGATGTVVDITPTGFTPGTADATEIVGYGIGRYGREAYGTRRSGTGFQLNQVASWSFSLFGETLLAQFRGDGPLCKWQPGVDARAIAIAAAPINAQAVLVTPERIVMLIFAQPRKVQWSAREDFTTWTPTITNTAGDQTLSGPGKLVEIRQVGRDILINSTKDAHVGKFLGSPFIYGFESVGTGCGSDAPNGTVVVGSRAYWVGNGGFWTYDGSARKLVSDVDDWMRATFSPSQVTKTYGFALEGTREIWWFFQSTEASECDRYVAYCYDEGPHWFYGRLDRTVGMAAGPSNQPVYVGVDGVLYDHEVPGLFIPDGYQDYAETGPLELRAGGQIMGVQFFYPDLIPERMSGLAGDDGAAVLEIIGRDWPSPHTPERTWGPYPLDRPVPTTGARGREIRLRYKGTGGRWRGGRQRMVVTGLGER